MSMDLDVYRMHMVSAYGAGEDLNYFIEEFLRTGSAQDRERLVRAQGVFAAANFAAGTELESDLEHFPKTVWITPEGEATTEGPDHPGDGYVALYWDSFGL